MARAPSQIPAGQGPCLPLPASFRSPLIGAARSSAGRLSRAVRYRLDRFVATEGGDLLDAAAAEASVCYSTFGDDIGDIEKFSELAVRGGTVTAHGCCPLMWPCRPLRSRFRRADVVEPEAPTVATTTTSRSCLPCLSAFLCLAWQTLSRALNPIA